jgi:hypothetical protein
MVLCELVSSFNILWFCDEGFYGRDKQMTALQTNRLDISYLLILVDSSSSIFTSKGKFGTSKKKSGTNGGTDCGFHI